MDSAPEVLGSLGARFWAQLRPASGIAACVATQKIARWGSVKTYWKGISAVHDQLGAVAAAKAALFGGAWVACKEM